MRVVAALFLTFGVVLAIPRPDVVHNSYDDVNGDVTAQKSVTDVDGNTRKTVENGVNPNGNDGFLANNDVFSQANRDNGNDNNEDHFTGTVQQSSSSYTTTTDNDGNVNTVGNSSNMSGVVNGNQVNDNGNVYGNQSMQMTRNNSSMEGRNGQYNVKSDEYNANEQKSKNADGETSYENHYTEKKSD